MIDTVKTILVGVVFIIIGGAIGALTMWGAQRVKIAELESERDKAVLERVTMQEQWEKAVNELNSTRVLLNDTLAALELLRQYQSIDEETRRNINRIDNTLDPEGNATEDTYEEFRNLVDEFNRLQGTMVTDSGMVPDILDLRPFEQVRIDAESLFKEATDLLLQYKED